MRDPIYEGVSVEDTQSSWERFIAVTDNDTTSETEDLVFAIEGDIVTSEGNVGLDAVPDPAFRIANRGEEGSIKYHI